jgi:hypothetical protein
MGCFTICVHNSSYTMSFFCSRMLYTIPHCFSCHISLFFSRLWQFHLIFVGSFEVKWKALSRESTSTSFKSLMAAINSANHHRIWYHILFTILKKDFRIFKGFPLESSCYLVYTWLKSNPQIIFLSLFYLITNKSISQIF